MEDHRHAEDGSVIVVPVADPEVAEAGALAEASVEVARIQADRDVQLAKIEARSVEPDLEAQLAAALAEVDALRTQLAPPAVEQPAPVEVPVIVDAPVQVEQPDQSPPMASQGEPESAPAKKRVGLGMW
jgi:hypothetical protein